MGTRMERWTEINYSKECLELLPEKYPFCRLYAEFIHEICHPGVSSTVSKLRLKYWSPNLQRIVRLIVIVCKVKHKALVQQVMGPLPDDRFKPAPP